MPAKTGTPPVIRVGGLTVNTARKLVSVGGERVRLTRSEYAMLEFIATHSPVPCSAVAEKFYGGHLSGPQIVWTTVYNIRQKFLAASGGRHRFIEEVRSTFAYRLSEAA